MSRRIAVVDIGTVTTRLLVADVDEESVREVERSVDITHLGENLSETGALAPQAMQRVADVIARYAERIDLLGVAEVRAVATSASRDAANGEEFLGLLRSHGLEPQIISGKSEARLSFAGATLGRHESGLLVIDVGGGSTEMVLGAVSETRAVVDRSASVDVGSRRITEMFLSSDPPAPREIASATEHVRAQIVPFFEGAGPIREVIAVAGTATTLSAIAMEMAEYDHECIQDSVITVEQIREMLARLASLPLGQRKRVVGLHPDRAYVIVAGALILLETLDAAGRDSTTVSDRDILYGMLLDAYHQAR